MVRRASSALMSSLRGSRGLAAMLTWRVYASERGEALHRILSGVTAIRCARLRRAANTWVAFAAEARKASAILTKTIGANVRLRQAWSSWTSSAEAERVDAELQRRAVMAHIGLLPAFEEWAATASELAWKRSRLRSALAALPGLKLVLGEGRHLRSAFKEWVAAAVPLARQGRAVALAGKALVAQLRGGGLRRAINTWRLWRDERTRAMTSIRQFVLAWRRQSLARASNAWRATASASRRAHQAAERALSGWVKSGLRSVWTTWTATALPCARQLRRISAALSSWSGKGLRAAWLGWATTALPMAQQRRALLRAARVMSCSGLSRALRTWQQHASAVREADGRIRAALSGMGLAGGVTRLVLAAMRSWKEEAANLAAQIAAARELIASLKGAGRRRGFNTWREFAAASTSAMTSLRHAAGAMRRSKLRLAANSWIEYAADVRGQRALLARKLNVWSGAGVHLAWASWLECATTRRRLISSVSHLLNASMAAALTSWRANALAAAAAEDAAYRVRKTLRSVGFTSIGTGRMAHKCMQRWAEIGRVAEVLRRSVRALKLRERRRAFASWEEHSSARKGALATAAHVLASMHLQHRRRALNAWTCFAAESREAHAILTRSAAALLATAERRAWVSWSEYTSERLQAMQSLAAVAGRLRKSGKLRALLAWRETAVGVAQAVRRIGGVLSTLGVGGVFAGKHKRLAFNAWAENALPAARQQRAVVRAAKQLIGALVHRGQRRAMSSWCEFVTGRLSALTSVRAAVAGLRQRGLRYGLNAWREMASDRAAAQSALTNAMAAWAGDGRRKAWLGWTTWVGRLLILRVSASRLSQLSKLRAFLGWSEVSSEEAKAHRRIRKALLAMGASERGARLRRGYNAWAELAAEATEERLRLRAAVEEGRLRRGLRRFRWWQRDRRALAQWHYAVAPTVQRRTAGCFHDWTRWVLTHRQEEREAKLVAQHARLTVRSWLRLKTARALRTWRGRFEWPHQRDKLMRAARRLLKGDVFVLFGWWRSSTERGGAVRRRALQAAARIAKGDLALGFSDWWDWVCEQRVHAQLVKAATRLVRGDVHLLFCWWKESCRAVRLHTAWVRRLRAKFVRLRLHAWRDAASEQPRILAAFREGKRRGAAPVEASLKEAQAALVESSSKSSALLAKYAEFRAQYEKERQQVTERNAWLESEVARLTTALAKSESEAGEGRRRLAGAEEESARRLSALEEEREQAAMLRSELDAQALALAARLQQQAEEAEHERSERAREERERLRLEEQLGRKEEAEEEERRRRAAATERKHRREEVELLAHAVQAEEARQAMRTLEWSRGGGATPASAGGRRRPRRKSWSPPAFRKPKALIDMRPPGPRRWLPTARGM